MSELQADAAESELPPIPFGEPEAPAEPEPELEPEAPAEPEPELEPAAELEPAEPPATPPTPPPYTPVVADPYVPPPQQDVQYVRIGGSGGVRVTTFGGVQTKKVSANNDYSSGVTIHRDTLAEIHARLALDPPDVAAALVLLPPVPAG